MKPTEWIKKRAIHRIRQRGEDITDESTMNFHREMALGELLDAVIADVSHVSIERPEPKQKERRPRS